jgi:ATP-dependent RNA circularization protein (DNA/RNA ligase family)
MKRTMRRVELVALVEERVNAYNILIAKPKGRSYF